MLDGDYLRVIIRIDKWIILIFDVIDGFILLVGIDKVIVNVKFVKFYFCGFKKLILIG